MRFHMQDQSLRHQGGSWCSISQIAPRFSPNPVALSANSSPKGILNNLLTEHRRHCCHVIQNNNQVCTHTQWQLHQSCCLDNSKGKTSWTVRGSPTAETLKSVRHVVARTEEIQHSYSFLVNLQLEIGVFIHLLSYNYKI